MLAELVGPVVQPDLFKLMLHRLCPDKCLSVEVSMPPRVETVVPAVMVTGLPQAMVAAEEEEAAASVALAAEAAVD